MTDIIVNVNYSNNSSGSVVCQNASSIKGDPADHTDPPQRRRGRCKWFNVAKGWGFITPLDGGPDVFVHQSVIKMAGFRSLGDEEEVEFECKISDKGLEATLVTGVEGSECKGSHRRPMPRKKIKKVRCYNCGEFANHIASKCNMGPQPKKCHQCKAVDHLVANCPLRDEKSNKSKNSGSSVASDTKSTTSEDANSASPNGNHKQSDCTGNLSDVVSSEEDAALTAMETASSSSEKHQTDSGIMVNEHNGKTSVATDDTKSEISGTSDAQSETCSSSDERSNDREFAENHDSTSELDAEHHQNTDYHQNVV